MITYFNWAQTAYLMTSLSVLFYGCISQDSLKLYFYQVIYNCFCGVKSTVCHYVLHVPEKVSLNLPLPYNCKKNKTTSLMHANNFLSRKKLHSYCGIITMAELLTECSLCSLCILWFVVIQLTANVFYSLFNIQNYSTASTEILDEILHHYLILWPCLVDRLQISFKNHIS